MFTKSPPVEIWEEIVYGVDSGRDLLSLALVSRSLSSMIVPHHLPYWHIRCDIRSEYVWEYLAAHPGCARAVRFLELIDEGPSNLPKLPPVLCTPIGNRHAHIESSILALIRSLSYMPNLSAFKWSRTYESHSDFVAIYRALLDGPTCLRALSLHISRPFKHDVPNTLSASSLVRVVLYNPCKSILELLQRCPNLEDLCLGGSDCFSVFKDADWRKLRRLTCKAGFLQSMTNRTELADFYQRHSTLESLMLTVDLSSARLPDSSLQMLRSISFDIYNRVKPTSFLSERILSNIVHYKTDVRNLDCTARMPSLETLQFFTSYAVWDLPDIKHFLENAPNLRKICLDDSLFPMDTKRLVAALASSSKVTHVYHSTLFHSEELAEKTIGQFSRIQTLQYMRLFIKNQGTAHCVYKEITRNWSGKYLGHLTMPYSKSKIGPPPSEWGDFFEEL